MPPLPILVPLLNANEPEARLVEIHAQAGAPVQKGDLLFTLETTKAAAEVEAPEAGFFRPVAETGATLAVGEILAYLTVSADEPLPVNSEQLPVISERSSADKLPGALRLTKPARALAETLGLDLAHLPTDRLVTEAVVREQAGAPVTPATLTPAPSLTQFTETQILLYGAGGHAKAVLEMIQALGVFQIAGIIDDNPALAGTSVLGIPVLGTGEMLPHLRAEGLGLAANGVGGIINLGLREKLFERLAALGFALPSLQHPRATVEASAQIGAGVQVFANAYVGSSALLAERCMINTGAIISHDCEIGAYTHIAPGALLAGHVHVGARALVGMGVTTTIGLKIGAGARIGNGAVLLADVPEKALVPAGKVWTA
jgi:sugar O-acyltransferase (sialic acid O-acetyltransferase NeuD family)